ncbi:MAG: ABC transporter permease [Deltaproteobacteria bacterium]|nr:ABC transporter permease [Deltaproteobacteria bacterium]
MREKFKFFPRIFLLLARCMKLIFMGRIDRKILFEQAYGIGNGSVVFIAVVLSFLGLITVYQSCFQIKQILPDLSAIGAGFIQIMVKEFGPTITALMIATRVGSGIAAEIGSMMVTEQIDALKMCNTDPVEYIIVPKFLSCLIMTIALSIFAVIVAVIAGMLMAYIGFDINPNTFLNLRFTDYGDMITGLWKALFYGAAIPIIAAESGLRAKGGSEGVGWATTRAVVNTSFAVIVLDFLIGTLGYYIF